ncbi:iron complex transport system permease protein [Marmoricola sp. OAE513]|uniref:FecCD family ABC transporter permease n=1 Tax=Marmoricola sp. OAE513 TaxID=2817894 RepID=UPI001DD4031A
MTVTTRPPTSPAVRATSRHLAIRTRAASGRVPLRAVVVALGALVALAFTLAWSVSIGDLKIPFGQVIAVLTGGGEETNRFIITELRIPRAAVGIVVGACLGLSGALFQTFARNALASPDVLGITDGAAVGALFVIVLGSTGGVLATGVNSFGVTGAALLGALVASLLLYVLAWRRGIDGTRLVLVGVGLQAIFLSGISWLLSRADIYDLPAALAWLSGSIADRGWHEATPAIWAFVVLAPVALVLSRTLRALQLGDDSARGLGVRLQVAQGVVLLVAVGLAAFAVSASGPIDFVAFVVPQIALRLVGGSRPPLVTSAILGALLVLVADTLTRAVLPYELPVGVVTAMIGAPYLLWLLARANRKAST